MTAICVFCSASNKIDQTYIQIAKRLGQFLGGEGFHLVYGGASVGTMGVLADAALEAGGEVTGVIPEMLKNKELAHAGLTELHITQTMQERQKMMSDLAEAFVVLPGGLGTLAEFTEIITWRQIGAHGKPVFMFNFNGYWDALLHTFEYMGEQGFLHGEAGSLFETIDDFGQLADKLRDIKQ